MFVGLVAKRDRIAQGQVVLFRAVHGLARGRRRAADEDDCCKAGDWCDAAARPKINTVHATPPETEPDLNLRMREVPPETSRSYRVFEKGNTSDRARVIGRRRCRSRADRWRGRPGAGT